MDIVESDVKGEGDVTEEVQHLKCEVTEGVQHLKGEVTHEGKNEGRRRSSLTLRMTSWVESSIEVKFEVKGQAPGHRERPPACSRLMPRPRRCQAIDHGNICAAACTCVAVSNLLTSR